MTITMKTIGQRRFRTIAALALRGDPRRAVAGLYYYVTRRRVRGWGQLLVAAAAARQSYQRWVGSCERQHFEQFRAAHPKRSNKRLCVIVVPDGARDGATADTLRSVRSSIGADVALLDETQVQALADGPAPPTLATVLEAARAKGADWCLAVLAGDRIAPELADIAGRAIAANPDCRLVYWDEDCLEANKRSDPWIKPGWDPVLFTRCRGLAGASLMSVGEAGDLAGAMGDLPFDRGGLEALEFALASERPDQVVHVPLILTHRCEATRLPRDLATPAAPPSGDGGPRPSVSIIVPTRDRADLLGPCIKGIADTRYRGAVELIIVDNGSVDETALSLIEAQRAAGATIIRDDRPFNFSRLNNVAARKATGDFLCFYNNDVEPLGADWLERMIDKAIAEDVGAVGALLLYPSGRIQHAGVAVGLGGAAGHIQKRVNPDEPQFRTWHQVTRQVSAVTAAVMVVRKRHFEQAGGFDELAFPVAFNDVDLCLRLRQLGLQNLFVAEARLLHRESESRGDDRRPERAPQFAKELAALQDRWQTQSFDDPFFSPLFVRSVEQCVLQP